MSDKPIIWFLEPFDTESQGMIEKAGKVYLGPRDRALSENELVGIFADASAVVLTSRDKISRHVIESARKLKIIAKCGAKPSNIDLRAATERRIPVTYTPGSNPMSVAEHAIALMLILLKKIVPTMETLKRGGWREESVKALELSGKTVGIIGLGQAGYQVVRLLQPFSCRVIFFDPYVPSTRGNEVGAHRVELDILLSESDIVSLHCPLDERTHHLIDEPQLKKMKRAAYLVNTGRGPLVNEASLVMALKEGWIAGAGIDVFEEEPAKSTNPLLCLPNTIVTPHMAGWSHEALRREAVWAAEEVIRVLRGEFPKNVVNPESLC